MVSQLQTQRESNNVFIARATFTASGASAKS